jgi:hypothetical protein
MDSMGVDVMVEVEDRWAVAERCGRVGRSRILYSEMS